jgi:hypothetical protein
MAERKPFLLRIDPELWAEIESWAQAELRSVNGQIEYLLRRAIQERRGEGASRASHERKQDGRRRQGGG